MKTLILGAGGIGGYFGAHLMRVGADITYLVRPKRKALLDTQGLRIETPSEHFVVQPCTVTADEIRPVYDLIVLAPKSYDLDDAIQSVSGAMGKGLVLPFLNGLDHLDKLDALLGKERVMGGVAHIAATITPDGAVRQLTAMHRLTIGTRHPTQQTLASEFMALARKAPFESVMSGDIEQTLWDKWVFLATLAGMTTLCRGSVGDIVATSHGAAITLEMYQECCRVAEASGHPISADVSAQALAMLTAPGSTFTASMLRDLLEGNRTEHDHILGAMVRRGQGVGCPTPLMKLALTHLEVQAARGTKI